MPSERPRKPPRCPPGLHAAGSRLWKAITARFDLEAHEQVLLLEAARTLDRLGELEVAIATSGAVVASGRPNPALVEARQQQVVLARLLASLRIPDAEAAQPQRRGAARGTYRLHAVVGE